PAVPSTTPMRDMTGYTEIVPATATVTGDIVPLPLASEATIAASSLVPDSLRAHLTIEIINNGKTQIGVRYSLPDLAGTRITVMYLPVALQLLARYGTVFVIPGRYQMLPVLYVGGTEVARGAAADAGSQQTRRLVYTLPSQQPIVAENQLQVGDTIGVAIDF